MLVILFILPVWQRSQIFVLLSYSDRGFSPTFTTGAVGPLYSTIPAYNCAAHDYWNDDGVKHMHIQIQNKNNS